MEVKASGKEAWLSLRGWRLCAIYIGLLHVWEERTGKPLCTSIQQAVKWGTMNAYIPSSIENEQELTRLAALEMVPIAYHGSLLRCELSLKLIGRTAILQTWRKSCRLSQSDNATT